MAHRTKFQFPAQQAVLRENRIGIAEVCGGFAVAFKEKRFRFDGGNVYLAMIESMDNALGKVLDALKATGMFENTMLVLAPITEAKHLP